MTRKEKKVGEVREIKAMYFKFTWGHLELTRHDTFSLHVGTWSLHEGTQSLHLEFIVGISWPTATVTQQAKGQEASK